MSDKIDLQPCPGLDYKYKVHLVSREKRIHQSLIAGYVMENQAGDENTQRLQLIV